MRKFRRTLGLLITLCLVLTLFAGCGSGKDDDEAETSDTSSEETTGIDYDAAFETFPADELIMTAGEGGEIYWNEYFYWLHNIVASYMSYYGSIDWTQETEYEGETITIGDYMLLSTQEYTVYFRAIEAYAAEQGVSLTDEEIEEAENSVADGYDSEEDMLADFEEKFITRDLMNYYYTVSALSTKLFESKYGENAENFTDEEVAAYAQENEYMQAKHILLKTVDDSGTALSDEEVAAKLATAEEVLALLDAYSGDDINAYFDELITEYNEDTGVESSPNGYLFTSGTMVEEFETAAAALGDYEYSGIVETSYGYHIILSLPINPDDTPISGDYSLRYTAAQEEFTELIAEKLDSLKITYSDAHAEINPSEMFAVAES